MTTPAEHLRVARLYMDQQQPDLLAMSAALYRLIEAVAGLVPTAEPEEGR